jgi:hypothetical protein
MATFRKIGDRWSAEVYVNGIRKSKRHDTKAQAKSWAAQTEIELGLMVDGLSEIAEDPSQWSQKCLYCIEAYGSGLKRFLDRIESESHESIVGNCAVIYFFREYRYWSKADTFNSTDVALAFQKLENVIDVFSSVDVSFQGKFRKFESKIDTEALRFRVNNESFQKLLNGGVSLTAIDNRILELTELLHSKTFCNHLELSINGWLVK